jgi:hypothetical protein
MLMNSVPYTNLKTKTAMNRKSFFIGLIAILATFKGYSQTDYTVRVESGFIKYLFQTVDVYPNPDWKGYYLDGQNGFDLNVINGIKHNEKLYAGIGVGYLNFEGTSGVSLFTDFEYLPLKKYALRPLLGFKIGYSHIWNQYENGTGTALAEFGLGLNYKLNEKFDIYIKSGFLFTQQSCLIPIRIGIRL